MFFDGITVPILQVSFSMDLTVVPPSSPIVDPGATRFVLDRDHLDTGQLGTTEWFDFSADTIQVSYSSGQAGELDSPTPGHCTVVLDNFSGNYDPSNSSGLYYTYFQLGIPVWIRAIWAGVTYDLWRGNVSDISVDAGFTPQTTVTCDDALEVMGRAQFVSSYPDADATGTRIGRILDAAQWPSSLRSLDTGYSLCQATNDAATSALQQLTDTVATELGLLVADGSGNVAFYDRLHPYLSTRSTSVQATFSDVGTDIDMLTIVQDRSNSLLYNQTRITRNGGTEQVFDATSTGMFGQTSQQQFGVRTYAGQAGTLLRSDPDAYALGGFIVARFQYPTDRLLQINVDGAAQGQWTNLLGIRYLDRVRAIRDYGPNTIDKQGAVIGIAGDITEDSWQFTFNTRNIDDFAPFILDNTTYGKLTTGSGKLA
jgi:hypothetical protein